MDIPTQFLRIKALDYLYSSLLAIDLLNFMLVPAIKEQLKGKGDGINQSYINRLRGTRKFKY